MIDREKCKDCKSLPEGRVIKGHDHRLFMTNPQQIIERLASKEPCNLHPIQDALCSVCNFLGKQVYIGDVLKKVKSIYGNSIEWLSYSHSLVDKWEPLGLDKALQQIVEESGYDLGCEGHEVGPGIFEGCSGCCETGVLRSNEARTLFEFLDTITQTI